MQRMRGSSFCRARGACTTGCLCIRAAACLWCSTTRAAWCVRRCGTGAGHPSAWRSYCRKHRRGGEREGAPAQAAGPPAHQAACPLDGCARCSAPAFGADLAALVRRPFATSLLRMGVCVMCDWPAAPHRAVCASSEWQVLYPPRREARGLEGVQPCAALPSPPSPRDSAGHPCPWVAARRAHWGGLCSSCHQGCIAVSNHLVTGLLPRNPDPHHRPLPRTFLKYIRLINIRLGQHRVRRDPRSTCHLLPGHAALARLARGLRTVNPCGDDAPRLRMLRSTGDGHARGCGRCAGARGTAGGGRW